MHVISETSGQIIHVEQRVRNSELNRKVSCNTAANASVAAAAGGTDEQVSVCFRMSGRHNQVN